MAAQKNINGVTKQQVYDLLYREADMDGVAIVSATAMASKLGLTSVRSVHSHIKNLVEEGKITVEPQHIRYNMQVLHILELN